MCSASGWLARGKNEKNQISVRKMTETTLIHMPCLPKFHRAAGKGSFRIRLIMMQTNEMMYEERREATPNEAIALKAAVEPMLIKDRRTVMTNETITAFTGTFQPGFTCSKQSAATYDYGRQEPSTQGGKKGKNSHAPGKRKMASLHPSQKQRAGEMPWQHC